MVAHMDHGLTLEQEKFVAGEIEQREFASRREPEAWLVRLPRALGTVPSALYGPDAGDPPVPDAVIRWRQRADRPWASRCVEWPQREIDTLVIVARAGRLITAYGGPVVSPREPWDVWLPEHDRHAALYWWRQHALAIRGES